MNVCVQVDNMLVWDLIELWSSHTQITHTSKKTTSSQGVLETRQLKMCKYIFQISGLNMRLFEFFNGIYWFIYKTLQKIFLKKNYINSEGRKDRAMLP